MADRINELYQALIDAKAGLQNERGALNALLDQQTAARATYQGLLKKQAAGSLTEAETAQVPGAEAAHAGFDARISAQRKLVASAEAQVLDAEKEHDAERARLAAEDAKLRANPSGRIQVQVGAPNAAKDPKRGFENHSDFLRSVMRANTTGQVDPRLVPLATQGTDEQQAASNPYGGFFVPVGIAGGVLSISPEMDPLESLVTQVPMTAPSVKYNARVDKNHATSVSGGFRVYRRPETVDGTASRGQFEQITLTANEEMGVAFATETILTDSPESFIAIIRAGMGDEFVANRMDERINGTGSGERQGVLNAPCLISVAKEGAQTAATIQKENIDKMAARCWRYNQAAWLANNNTLPQLLSIVQIVGTGGQPVPYFSFNPNGGQFTLLGRPLFFTEFCPALGTVGDLILGVWSQYLEGTYQTEQFAESMHVRFLAAERAFRFYRRNDGQWWWRSALTPRAGDTLSPTVVLATRA